MKKTSLALIGLIPLLAQCASAQILFSSYQDFSQWQGINSFPATAVASPDSDGGLVNGLANTNAAGGTATGGALAIYVPSTTTPYNYAAASPGLQGTTNVIALLEQPGKVLTFDYQLPAGATGTYFQVGVVVNCDNLFSQSFPTSTTTLGGGWIRATVDWSAVATNIIAAQTSTPSNSFSYFQLLVLYNSDYYPTQPFYVDNYVLRNPPAPPVKLFTTTNDFTGWTTEVDASNVGPTNFDLDGATTNGLGNLTAPGAAGGPGSLSIQWGGISNSNYGVASFSPFEQGNAAFVAALEQASVLTFDYTTPVQGTGTYFEAGVVASYQSNPTNRYDQLFWSTTTAVSGTVSRASIDWVLEGQAIAAAQAANGGSFSNFQIGILWNSDYNPGATPFQVDNIAVTTNPPAAYLIPASAALVAQNCAVPNGAINPGETVTVDLALQNTGNAPLSNVVATLQSVGGVTLPSGPQSYGTLLANGGAATNSFSFTAEGTCGGVLTATLLIQTNSAPYRTVPYGFTMGAPSPVSKIYSTGGVSIPIPDKSSNTVSITVSDANVVSNVTVSIRMSENYDGDISMNLIHPDGTVVELIAYNPVNGGQDFGTGATDCTGTFTVFDDSAATAISAGSSPYAGSYRPVTKLGVLDGKSTLGTWKLQIVDTDTTSGDIGTLSCAQLNIGEITYTCCSSPPPPSDPFTTWQDNYFTSAELGTASYSGANADPLGKGISNTNQFLAGFNPTNSAAYPHIISITKTNGNADVNVIYLGASGDSTYTGGPASRTNVLEYTTGTANGSYTNTFISTGHTNILSGGTGLGAVTSAVDSGGATNKPSRYYRVRVLLP
ncbi:MAG TPA: proprotein convertase P-domain-containing protein [Verrucomicrobiae bacterium]|nr:proprotein convertase P-domain-containing protein [Verrucomicrobiae bacterium]